MGVDHLAWVSTSRTTTLVRGSRDKRQRAATFFPERSYNVTSASKNKPLTREQGQRIRACGGVRRLAYEVGEVGAEQEG